MKEIKATEQLRFKVNHELKESIVSVSFIVGGLVDFVGI